MILGSTEINIVQFFNKLSMAAIRNPVQHKKKRQLPRDIDSVQIVPVGPYNRSRQLKLLKMMYHMENAISQEIICININIHMIAHSCSRNKVLENKTIRNFSRSMEVFIVFSRTLG